MNREEWISDIYFVKEKIQKVHPNPYIKITEEVFEERVDEILNSNGDVDYEKMIRRLVADIGDMHTTTIDLNERWRFPIDIKLLDGEFLVENISQEKNHMRGFKVKSINDIPIWKIYNEIISMIPNENDVYRKYYGEKYLSSPEMLKIMGLKETWREAQFSIQDNEGKIIRLYMEPLMRKKYDSPYEWRYIEESRILYIKCRACMDNSYIKASGIDDYIFVPNYYDFIDEIFRLIQEKDVDRVVYDLRDNIGGQLKYPKYLFLKLQESDKWNEVINKRENFLVFINSGVVSAGVETCKYLRENTEALFIGEATGGNLRVFGVRINGGYRLPNSKIHLMCSSHKGSSFLSVNDGNFIPDIEVKVTKESITRGEDSLIQYVYNNKE